MKILGRIKESGYSFHCLRYKSVGGEKISIKRGSPGSSRAAVGHPWPRHTESAPPIWHSCGLSWGSGAQTGPCSKLPSQWKLKIFSAISWAFAFQFSICNNCMWGDQSLYSMCYWHRPNQNAAQAAEQILAKSKPYAGTDWQVMLIIIRG